MATNGKGLLSLSEEQIVSCDKADGNDGCNGGDQLPALLWLAKQPNGQVRANRWGDGERGGWGGGVGCEAVNNTLHCVPPLSSPAVLRDELPVHVGRRRRRQVQDDVRARRVLHQRR